MSAAPHLDDLPRTRLGDIASAIPGSTAVMRRYGLDFCCGGDVLLVDAPRPPGVSLEQITRELEALDASAPREHPVEPDALIDHILERYHATHRRELPELITLAEKVERVHAAHPAAPLGLAAALRALAQELETHMRKEEEVLFPMMRTGPNPVMAHAIARMRLEHDDHGERLREIETLCRSWMPPADACNSWRALYVGGRKLVDDLMHHVHLENNVLFPQFATELPSTPICPGMLGSAAR